MSRTNDKIDEEVKKQMGRDPIDKFKALCLESSILSQEEISELDEQIDSTVQEAREFAENSPEPSESDLYSHIYADSEVS